MGSATPPKRMTRARAAATSTTATTLGPKSTKTGRVSKPTKAADPTKATVASAKKVAAAVKTAAVKKPVATTTVNKAPAAKKATDVEKATTTEKRPAAKTAVTARTTTVTSTTSTSSSTSVSISTSTSAATVSSTARPTTTRKRKARNFDGQDDDGEDELSKEENSERAMNQAAKKPRAPAKKAVDPKPNSDPEAVSESESEPEIEEEEVKSTAAKSTRGRPKKSTATAATASTSKKQVPSAAIRTRARKPTTKTENTDAGVKKPVKKAARGRAATGTITTTYNTEPTPGLKSAVSRPTSKAISLLKKTVTFQEPEKENVDPETTVKAQTETGGVVTQGMRAKPVRKAAVSGRTTRASARTDTEETPEKKPLSPKKDGQNRPLSRDSNHSDDELATYEKTPLKPLTKSPVKPPSGVRKLELPAPEKEMDENSILSPDPVACSVLTSPARRPPPSPYKDAMKSPAKRVDAVPSLLFSTTNTETQGDQPLSKLAMLQSPAKRPHMPLQAFPLTQEHTSVIRSPTKMSLLNTPAKRPASPLKLLGKPIPNTDAKPEEDLKEGPRTPTEEISEEELQSQIRAETGVASPEETANSEKYLKYISEDDMEDSIQLDSPTPRPTLTGRLSALLPKSILHPPLLSRPDAKLPKVAAEIESPQDEEEFESSVDVTMSDPESESEDLSVDDIVSESNEEAVNSIVCETIVSTTQCSDATTAQALERETTPIESELSEQSKESNELESEQPCAEKDEVEKPDVPASVEVAPQSPLERRSELADDTVSESEDELAFSNKAASKFKNDVKTSESVLTTPAAPLFKSTERKITESVARAASRAIRSISKSGLGYTPLSVQLGAWKASSPLKARQAAQKGAAQEEDDDDEFSLLDENDFPVVETPAPKGFFADEMKVRADMQSQVDTASQSSTKAEASSDNQSDRDINAEMEALLDADIEAKFAKHNFYDLGITEYEESSFMTEDDRLPLANAADDEQPGLHTESISEASQEYGDENSVPIDPALFGNGADETSNYPPITPKRTIHSREVYTVSKVPLKRGDDSPPRDTKRKCATASKAAVTRNHASQEAESGQSLVTPSKHGLRSTVGTPARTPRPDLNATLLRGATVFVDVHTTEGADAGRVFVDLLTQMGARCVKSWPWNPMNLPGGEVDVSKIGITHVVFKDGGKRTLEKVIESNGAVECVGVSWVLDCEKENRWLAEKNYRVDTSLIPRGGHNRRKSMEPKAIANKNGTLVTPMKTNSGSSREPQTAPNKYMSRRESTVWMRSPSEHDDDEDAPSEPSEMDWESASGPLLTPVPKTPAPEMVAKFAMDISPSISTTGSLDSSPDKDQLLMRTCPPKPINFINPGEGLLNRDQDQSLQMRLMAARRKSMQFAPKIASPLKKQWKQLD